MQVSAKRNFILQQGFENPAPASCSLQYSALQFQPRIIFFWVLAATAFQSAAAFAVLAAVVWWNALLPRLNLFELVYNRTFGRRPAGFQVGPAPAPRRTAQVMAGTFALAIVLLISFGYSTAAYVVEGIFLAAVLALILGGFCLGSFVYHVLRGEWKFARQTLPWAR
jgi:hypothetical protein